MHTPGHDRGHLCFRESRYGTMLVGDMLSTISTIIIDPPEGHLATYLQSLERSPTQPDDDALSGARPGDARRPASWSSSTSATAGSARPSLEVLALQNGGGTVEELLPKVYWDADPKLFPYARVRCWRACRSCRKRAARSKPTAFGPTANLPAGPDRCQRRTCRPAPMAPPR
jgi:ribonuclease/clavin/mitogillin